MKIASSRGTILFSMHSDALAQSLCQSLGANVGQWSHRRFPDGESYIRVDTAVENRDCIVLADLSRPDEKFLPLIFLLDTLRSLGAGRIGLVAPYLCYLRQDTCFHPGEALSAQYFASLLNPHIDWLMTVDPHLHRYHSLSQLYSVPTKVVHGAAALADFLSDTQDLLLVGPDKESEQWLSDLSTLSGHDFVIAEKIRVGDREVKITLPNLSKYSRNSALIVDDIISSGHTILACAQALKRQHITNIGCVAVHGIFADDVDQVFAEQGLTPIVTTNTIPHSTNKIDIAPTLSSALNSFLEN